MSASTSTGKSFRTSPAADPGLHERLDGAGEPADLIRFVAAQVRAVDQLGEELRVHGACRDRVGGQRLEDPVDALARRGPVGEGAVEVCEDGVEGVGLELEQHLELRGEVVEEGLVRDVRLLADLRHGAGVVAPLVEEPTRGAHDSGAHLLPAAFPAGLGLARRLLHAGRVAAGEPGVNKYILSIFFSTSPWAPATYASGQSELESSVSFTSYDWVAGLVFVGIFIALPRLLHWLAWQDPRLAALRDANQQADAEKLEKSSYRSGSERGARVSMLANLGFAAFLVPFFLSLESRPLWQHALEIVAVLAIYDFLYYWLHRSLFHGKLLRKAHALHHMARRPTPVDSYYIHPIEAVSGIFVFMVAIPIVALIEGRRSTPSPPASPRCSGRSSPC